MSCLCPRTLFSGLLTLAAPTIIRTPRLLMPIKALPNILLPLSDTLVVRISEVDGDTIISYKINISPNPWVYRRKLLGV